LIRKQRGKKLTGRPRHRLEDHLKVDLIETFLKKWNGFIWFENASETSGGIVGGWMSGGNLGVVFCCRTKSTWIHFLFLLSF